MRLSAIVSNVCAVGLGLLTPLTAAWACDLCAIYSGGEAAARQPDTFTVGVAEQFSSFGRIQNAGSKIDNHEHQHLESSITQLFGAYDISSRFGVQVNLPYINRRYKRVEGGEITNGSEAGIGDLSMLLRYTPIHEQQEDWSYQLQFLAGVKLPTGDSDRITEELSEGHAMEESLGGEDEHAGHDMAHNVFASRVHGGVDHGGDGPISAVHGHDLTLGSGSVDFPVALNLFAQWKRAFFTGNLQYMFRTEGESNYEYADDLLWEAGPGYFLHLGHDCTVSLKANLSGEYKRKDILESERQGDTGIRSLFMGPQLRVDAGDWGAEFAWDVPLDINNTGVQAVVDYKIRAAVTYRF